MFLVFMLVVCFPRAFFPSHQPRFYYTSVNLSFPIAPLLLSCRKKTRSDKSLHIFDYNDVECVSHAYFSLFPLVDILFLFFNSSPTRICYLLFPFFLSSQRENIFLLLYLKLFVHSIIPSLSDDLKICYLRKFTFTRVVFHTILCCFYLQKMLLSTFFSQIFLY